MNSQQQIRNLPLSNKNSKHGSNRGRTNKMSKNQALDVELDNRIIKDVEEPDIVLDSITSHDESLLFEKDANVTINTMEHQFITPINITTSASDKTLSSAFLDDEDVCGGETSGSSLSLDLIPSSMPGSSSSTPRDMITGGVTPQPQAATSDEDNVIQGLLEDIRGSFERQFDDEFNFDEGSGKGDTEVVPGVIGSSSHRGVNIRSGGVSPNAFGVNIESDFNINPEEAAEVAAAVADMDIPDSEFLNAGSISQEEFDSFSNLLGNPGPSSYQPPGTNMTTPENNILAQQHHQSNQIMHHNPQDAVQNNEVFSFQNQHVQNPQESQFNLFQSSSNDSSSEFPF